MWKQEIPSSKNGRIDNKLINSLEYEMMFKCLYETLIKGNLSKILTTSAILGFWHNLFTCRKERKGSSLRKVKKKKVDSIEQKIFINIFLNPEVSENNFLYYDIKHRAKQIILHKERTNQLKNLWEANAPAEATHCAIE